ncbi:hypothetical protein C0416_01985 [bacterium]|nr:hypothetical protein [bacterium]
MEKRGKTVCGMFLILMVIVPSAKANPLVFLPFEYGESWYCTQGQGGTFSHQGNQYYGFDFNKASNVNGGTNPAYGKNLYAPVSGEVVEIRDGVSDFSNNTSSNAANNYGWGNTIVIMDREEVYYVRMAHLQYGSLDHLDVGDWVEQGDYIGKVGQTGYSTSPHLHIQIMESQMGASEPFTFAEGALYSYEWITSSLGANVSMLDNNGNVSLSNDFTFDSVSPSGTWDTKTLVDGFAGTNYKRHKWLGSNDTAYFQWRFSVEDSGWYTLYATYPGSTSHDPSARYYFDGAYLKTLNQTSTSPFIHYLGTKYLNSSNQYTIKVKGQTLNKYVVADAIVLKKI